MGKRIIIMLILFSLVLMPVLTSAATVDISVDTKAIALNKLGILQGDGISFNLTGQLKRSEAVTFIARALGKEAFIKTKINTYQTTTFNDVKETDWFAPYVGFIQTNM